MLNIFKYSTGPGKRNYFCDEMISNRLAKFFTALWICNLLITTTGFSIQAVYCYCLDDTYFTFEKDVSHSGCCEPVNEKLACCQSKEAFSVVQIDGFYHFRVLPDVKNSEKSTCKKGEGCLETTEISFLLKSDFSTAEEFTHTVQSFSDCLFTIPLDNLRLFPRQVILELPSNKAPPGSPPPISGRMRCILTQIYRC